MSRLHPKHYFTWIREFVLQSFIDVCFPPICIECDNLLADGRKIICSDCWEKIPPFKTHIDKALTLPEITQLFILFEFEKTIQQLIHLLKYEHHLTLAHYLALEMHHRFAILQTSYYEAIVPVPLYKTRKRERGYNQTEEIAKRLSELTHIPLQTEYLLRIRSTKTQTKMTKQKRMINVKDAFRCSKDLALDRILLLDDVITTGSTVQACAHTLCKAGVKQVDVITVAHPRKTS